MYEYDEECLQAFLEQQGKLFDEPVADTLEVSRGIFGRLHGSSCELISRS